MAAALEVGPCTSYSAEVAAWVPFSGGGASDRGAFPRLKTAARGVWLRASEEAVLSLEARPPGSSAAPAVLRVCLKGRRQLAACLLVRRALHCTALCPEHAGRGCWVLLLHMQAGGKDTTLAIRFPEDQWHAGQQCAALIQGLLRGTVRRVQAALGQPPVWGAAPAAVGAGEAGRPPEQPDDLKERVKALLLDPQFMAYVDEVERAWMEVEQELEGEMVQLEGAE